MCDDSFSTWCRLLLALNERWRLSVELEAMLVLHSNGKWCLGMYVCYGIVVYSAFGGFPSSSLTKCILDTVQ